jgi:hypothetical protein
MQNRRMKCIICDTKPAMPHSGFCHNCQAKMSSERARLHSGRKPDLYVTYQGYTVALYHDKATGKYSPKLIKREEAKLPKSITLNLNNFLPDYTREQIKNLKRAVLRVACA